jgi:hemerythrin
MTLIAWKEAFATGDAGIDHEHMEMIALINDLHRRMKKRNDHQEVAGFLAAIHDKIAAHFALEETEMRTAKYKRLDAHKADHERLLDSIREIMEGHAKGRYDDIDELLSTNLNDWFFIHFKTMDAALKKELGV